MRAPTFLYCIELIGAPIAKVGTSYRPMDRLSRLACTAPFDMRFRRVLIFEDRAVAGAHERHIIGRANQFRDQGEWVRCDDHLDALFDAVPGRDVTEDYRIEVKKGRRRRCDRRLDLEVQVGAKAARADAYTGIAKRFDTAVIRARLADGYGVEDILAMDGIPLEASRAVIAQLENAGKLRGLLLSYRLRAAAE